MPVLIITGHPCAGKTTVAKTLRERALIHPSIEHVILVNEESAFPDATKNRCYETPGIEKQTRGALKSAFDRAVGMSKTQKGTLVILDSLNYIKGFRYELHCISKAAGERHGVVWILNRLEVVKEWNAKRDEKEAYQPNVLDELVLRYEPPDDRNRWDKPLYTVDASPSSSSSSGPESMASKGEAVQRSVYNMHALGDTLVDNNATSTTTSSATDANNTSSTTTTTTKKPKRSAFTRAKPKKSTASSSVQPDTSKNTAAENAANDSTNATATEVTTTTTESPDNNQVENSQRKESKTLEQQLDDILESFMNQVRPLREGHSTRQHVAGNANVLQALDATTQQLISAIVTAQNFHTGGKLQVKLRGGGSTTSGSTLTMDCKRAIGLAELRRHRKQYLQWVGTHPPDDTTEEGIAASFLKYIEEQL